MIMSVTDPLGLDSVGGTGPGRPPDPGKVDLDTLVSIDDARHIQVHDLNEKLHQSTVFYCTNILMD